MNFSRILPRLALFVLFVVRFPVPVSAQQSSTSGITHSFFIAGPSFTGIIGDDGKEIWNSGKPGARDGFVLPNGHVLVCCGDIVQEFDKNKQVVFSYKKS